MVKPLLYHLLRSQGLRRILANIAWLFLDKVLRIGVGIVVAVWMARYLGPSDFGLLSFVTASVGLVAAVATLGISNIAVRDLAQGRESAGSTLGAAAALHVIGGFFAYGALVLMVMALRPDDPRAQVAALVAGGVLLVKASQIAVYWFESQVAARPVVLAQNSVFLAGACLTAAGILFSAPLMFFVWLLLTEALVASATLLLLLHRKGVSLTSLRSPASRIAQLLRESWPLALSGMAVVIYMKVDQIMLARMHGDTSVGIYAAAVRMSEVWYFVPVAIVASVFPAILAARQRSLEEFHTRLQALFDGLALVAVAIAVPMTFAATPLVAFLFGAAFAPAGQILMVHIWSALFVFVGVAGGRWFVIEGRQMMALQRTLIGACANVVLNLVLIPVYGPLGAAWATVASHILAAFVADAFNQETRHLFLLKLSALTLIGPVRRLATALRKHRVEA
jgi:O-antigen/teichoic acid export membrane protein